MPKLTLNPGTTSKICTIFIQDSTATDGRGLTGLTSVSTNLKWSYKVEGSSATAVTIVSATVGTFTSGGFVEVNATLMPGAYEIGLPNDSLTGGESSYHQLFGATNMIALPLEIELATTSVDLSPITADTTSILDKIGPFSGHTSTHDSGTIFGYFDEVLERIGFFSGEGSANANNTIRGFLQAIMRRDPGLTPSDVGGLYDNRTMSLETLATINIPSNKISTLSQNIDLVLAKLGNFNMLGQNSVYGFLRSIAINDSTLQKPTQLGEDFDNTTMSLQALSLKDSILQTLSNTIITNLATVNNLVILENTKIDTIQTNTSAINTKLDTALGHDTTVLSELIIILNNLSTIQSSINNTIINNLFPSVGNDLAALQTTLGISLNHEITLLGSVNDNLLTLLNVKKDITDIKSHVLTIPTGFMRNTEYKNFKFSLVSNLDHITPLPGQDVVAVRSIDDADFSPCKYFVRELSNGDYLIDFAPSDLDGFMITFYFFAVNADPRKITIKTVGPLVQLPYGANKSVSSNILRSIATKP